MKLNNNCRKVHMEDSDVHGVSLTAHIRQFNYIVKEAKKKEIPRFKTVKEFTMFKRAKLLKQKG